MAELLLESPVPPAVWLPRPSERRSRARLVVEAILKRRPAHRGWHPGHRMRPDLGYPYGSYARTVPGEEIEAEIESVLTHLNPPIIQGWLVAVLLVNLWWILLALRAASSTDPSAFPGSLAELAIVVCASIGGLAIVGFVQREIEVCEHGIVVRRWVEVWRGAHGRVIGLPEAIHARVRQNVVELDGPGTADVRIPTWLWPPSAHRSLAEDLRALGLRVDRDPETLPRPEPVQPSFPGSEAEPVGTAAATAASPELDPGRDRGPRVPELRTERLLLRGWRHADRRLFAAMNADREVMRHFPAPLSNAASDRLVNAILDGWEEHGFGLWAVEVEAERRFIGFVGLSRPSFEADFMPAVEVGWRLARVAWGHGYATEAARAALAFGFERLRLDEIVSFTVPANERSRRVMERLGMSHDPADDFDHPKLPEGHPLRRHVLYRLRGDEWLRRGAA